MAILAQPPRKEDIRFDDWMFLLWKLLINTTNTIWYQDSTYISSGTQVTIESNKSVVIAGPLTNDGIIVNNGTLMVL